jgi:hypothetical protein
MEKKKVKNKLLKHFKNVRPNLVRLFTQAILLYLSITSYMSFVSSESSYSDFLNNMQKELITDVIFIDSNKTCEIPFEEIKPTYFPKINDGCRCDEMEFETSTCNILYDSIKNSPLKLDWDHNCKEQDLLDSNLKSRNLAVKIPKPTNNFQPLAGLPISCKCFEWVKGNNEEKKIDIIFPNKRLCIRRGKLNSLDYLKSALSQQVCEKENVCQNYFCKTFNTSETNTTRCPLVDIYFDNLKRVKGKNNQVTLVHDDSVWNIFSSPYYNRTFKDNSTYETTIVNPILDIALTLDGRCVANDRNRLVLHYGLIDSVECPRDQRFYPSTTIRVYDVLVNSGNFESLSKFPGFNRTIMGDVKWNFESEYPFYKFTLQCLMNKVEETKHTLLQVQNTTNMSNLEFLKTRIGTILNVFLNFDEDFKYQIILQIIILGVNIFIIFVSLAVISYKFISYFCKCNMFKKFFDLETWVGFSSEIFLGILGGFSYFFIGQYINAINWLMSTDCVDNYLQYKLGIFSSSLDSSRSQNFQVFLIVLIKFFFILITSLFYLLNGRKLTCKIIEENVGEGGENSDEEDECNDGNKEKDENVASEEDRLQKKIEMINGRLQKYLENNDSKNGENLKKDEKDANCEINPKDETKSKPQNENYCQNNIHNKDYPIELEF